MYFLSTVTFSKPKNLRPAYHWRPENSVWYHWQNKTLKSFVASSSSNRVFAVTGRKLNVLWQGGLLRHFLSYLYMWPELWYVLKSLQLLTFDLPLWLFRFFATHTLCIKCTMANSACCDSVRLHRHIGHCAAGARMFTRQRTWLLLPALVDRKVMLCFRPCTFFLPEGR